MTYAEKMGIDVQQVTTTTHEYVSQVTYPDLNYIRFYGEWFDEYITLGGDTICLWKVKSWKQ